MRQWTVDAFAAAPFRGNPACVTEPQDAWRDAGWMQSLAAENNQAETAFLLKTADPARFGLRWFTPAVEAPLCGHATLASAHVLFTELGLAAPEITFDTLSGPLLVRRAAGGYEMDFPSQPPRRIDAPKGLAEALGAEVREVWAGAYLVALVDGAATVEGLKPDLSALARLGAEADLGPGNIGVSALAPAAADHDAVSRFFAPGSGIPEDPATGSLHCILAPLFAEKLGRQTLRFRQAYPGRGAELECVLAGDRVLIRGAAVTVIESRLRL
ncbi:MAG TPA: PhzF family phenazine biosynthesis protein [Caulobacteraceae bacterium]|nr:PhzF family phenazine biosynthesis protein [Caulobacteraceae bacterium]